MSKYDGIWLSPNDPQAFVFKDTLCSDFIWTSTQYRYTNQEEWSPDPEFYRRIGPGVLAKW